MKRVATILVFLTLLPAVAFATERILFVALQGVVVALALVILGFTIKGIIYAGKKVKNRAQKDFKSIAAQAKPKFDKIAEKGSAVLSRVSKTDEERVLEIDDIFFETAEYEVEHNGQNSGLWIKTSVLAEGDKAKQKAIYIRLRATQLSDEHRHKLEIRQTEEIEKEKREKELYKEKIRDAENEEVKKRSMAQFAALQASRQASHTKFVRIMLGLIVFLAIMVVLNILDRYGSS